MVKKGKKIKGKTIALADFLQETSEIPPSAPTTLRETKLNWANEVEDNCDQFDSRPKLNVTLPTAPRAARAVECISDAIPDEPPYIAYLSNLPYDVAEEEIAQLFGNLKISTLKIPKEERPSEKPRLKGFGYVEFADKNSLIEALNITDCTLNSRRIRIEIAKNSESERRERVGGRDNNRDRPDRPEVTSGNWRSGLRSDIATNSESERRGRGDRIDNNRDRSDRPEVASSNWRSGPRIEIATNSECERRGRGDSMDYNRNRPNRPEVTSGSWRSRDSENGVADRACSWRDNGDTRRSSIKDSQDSREFSRDSNREGFDRDNDNRRPFVPRRNDMDDFSRGSNEIRTRQKLILQPKSVANSKIPVESEPLAVIQETNANITMPIASSIFGGARPVDTSAREKEIGEKIEMEKTTKDWSHRNWGKSDVKRRESNRRRSPCSISPKAWSPTRGSQRTSPRSGYSPQRNSPQRFSPRWTSPSSRRDYSPDNSYNTSSNNSRKGSLGRPSSRGRSPPYRSRSPPSRDPSLEYKRHSPERLHSSQEARNRSPERAYQPSDQRKLSPPERESPYRNMSPCRRKQSQNRNRRAAEARKPLPDSKTSHERSAPRKGVPPPRKTDEKRGGAPPSRVVDRRHKTEKVRPNKARDNRQRELPKLKELEAPNFTGSNKYAFLKVDDDSD